MKIFTVVGKGCPRILVVSTGSGQFKKGRRPDGPVG